MEFEWDDAKNQRNIEKHGIAFEDACTVFEGFTFNAPDDRFDYGEDRTFSIGMMHGILAVVVIHTDRTGKCRLISARQANRKERDRYEKALQQATEH